MFKNKLKIFSALLAATGVLALMPFGAFAESGNTRKLTILHTNDTHGNLSADAYISQMANDLRESGENVLVLDAGDTLHGQTAAILTKGEAAVNAMNAAGFDAMTCGNHDFNYGAERLLELSGIMDFPVLAANVKKDGKNLFESYKIFELNGMKAGVIGLATPETITDSDPRIVAGLTFEDPAETAEAIAAELKALGCDVIIALAHLGTDYLPGFKPAGVDVVIDAHSHTALENGENRDGMLIAQTGSGAVNIGKVEILSDEGGIVSKTAELITIPQEGEETALIQDQKVFDVISSENSRLEAITSETVGHTGVYLNGEKPVVRTSETNLANLITDSMLFATGADISFLTGGNIRASIEQGDITMGQALTVLPFSNILVTVELTGAEILEVLEHGVSKYPEAVGQHIQAAGLNFEFNPDAEPANRVTKFTLADGNELDLNATYTVATIDFLASGGDGYEMLADKKKTLYQGDLEAFVQYLATEPEMKEEAEGRISTVIPAIENTEEEAETAEETATVETTSENTEKTSENTEKTENPVTGITEDSLIYVVFAVSFTGIIALRKKRV